MTEEGPKAINVRDILSNLSDEAKKLTTRMIPFALTGAQLDAFKFVSQMSDEELQRSMKELEVRGLVQRGVRQKVSGGPPEGLMSGSNYAFVIDENGDWYRLEPEFQKAFKARGKSGR